MLNLDRAISFEEGIRLEAGRGIEMIDQFLSLSPIGKRRNRGEPASLGLFK